jgi:hypothetical protein
MTAPVTATVAELLELRRTLVALRNGALTRLSKKVGRVDIDLVATLAAAVLAVDDRLEELRADVIPVRQLGDPGRQ